MHLNIDVKYTPSKAAICFIICEHYFCKVKAYCVASISHAKCIICERKRRNTCIHVQFGIVHIKFSCVRPSVVVHATTIEEMTSVAKHPIWSCSMKSCWSSFLWVIIIFYVSIRNWLSSTIYMERVPSWDNKKKKREKNK